MVNYHFQYKGISIYYVENMGTVSETVKEIKPHIFNTVPRLLEKIYDNIIGKGKNLPWVKKRIFFWAVNLGLKFRLKGNSAFYKFRLKIARKLIFSKWKEALGGELQVLSQAELHFNRDSKEYSGQPEFLSFRAMDSLRHPQ
jgi:long-chain acyl-CoA synthetase